MAVRRYMSNKMDGSQYTIEGGEYNRLVNVMRAKIGDKLTVRFSGGDIECTVARIDRAASAAYCEKTEASAPVSVRAAIISLTLFQAIPKGDKLDNIVRHMSELGTAAVVPMTTEYTAVGKDTGKVARLRKIAEESVKQCGRSDTMEIGEVAGFPDAVAMLKDFDLVIFPYEKEMSGDLRAVLGNIRAGMKIALIVGSEGGFSPREAEILVEAGAKLVTLGPRILKADTAAVATASAILFGAGEWVR